MRLQWGARHDVGGGAFGELRGSCSERRPYEAAQGTRVVRGSPDAFDVHELGEERLRQAVLRALYGTGRRGREDADQDVDRSDRPHRLDEPLELAHVER